jgi:hypothetical protein
MFDPRIEVLKKVKWNGEKQVGFEFESGVCWSGAKRKDFWHPDDNWEKIIKPGCKIRTWTVQWCIVLGFEVWVDDANWGKNQTDNWRSVWCLANNFEIKSERKKQEDGYANFIRKEGIKIAKLIDKGKSLKELDKLISKEHSGNTYACALSIGISKARNKVNADKVRKEHNELWGVKEADGVVNPAVLTVSAK